MVGDTHGGARDVKEAVRRARDFQTDRIFILGDFGLWWGYEGVRFIDEINEFARANNVHIFALPGNHENYDWWNATLRVAPTSKGFAYLRTNVLLSPRVHEWRWAGKQFVVAGGAVSIDKEWRLEKMRNGAQPLWSPDEQLTEEEITQLGSWGVKADYLLTHDCSNHTPFFGRLKPDLDSQLHRQKIDRVIKLVKPRMHLHGHMHTKYVWHNTLGTDAFGATPEVEVDTYGLECNDDWWAWGILDTEKDEFLFRGEHTVPADQHDDV